MEDGRVDGRFGVLHVRAATKGPVVVVECNDQRSIRVGGTVGGEIVKGGDERGVGGDGVESRSAPHEALGEGFEVEASDDAEIVAPAAQGEVEVWVRGVVYVGD